MAITAETRTAIIELVVTAYNAAPGTALLTELVAIVDAGGSLADVATELTTRTEWTSKFPSFQTAGEFGAEWLGALVPEASAATLAEGVLVVEGLVAGGSTFAEIIIAAQGFLAALPITDTAFGTSAANFNNKVAVASYHTITLEQDTSGSLAGVTSDVGTVATANAAADAAAGGVAGQVTLTVGSDKVTGASFLAENDFVPGTGYVNTLNDNDALVGTGDNATLTAVMGAANDINDDTSVQPELSNVKTVSLEFTTGTGDGATVNLRDANDDVTNVNITRVTQDSLASVTEMGPSATNLSISNSTNGGDIVFNHQEETLTGSETVNLALKSVRTDTVTMTEAGDGDADTGYYFETVNITTSGTNDLDAMTIGANAVEDASAADLDQDITITANGAATLLGLEVNALLAPGAETITIEANSRVEIATDNRIALAAGNDGISTAELNTLTISGAANVMIDGLDGADAMITVAAGEMTGNLTLGIQDASDATTSGVYATGTDEDLSVTSGSGDDTIETYEALAGDITTNAGDDSVTVGGNMEGVSAISTGEGDDSVTAEDMQATATDRDQLGNQNYTVQGAQITTGAGDDTVNVDALASSADWNNNGTVDANNNDTQVITGAMIDTGEGADTITFETVAEGASVNAGAGDDTISVALTNAATILAGDTDDNQQTLVTAIAGQAAAGRTDEVNADGTVNMLGAIVDMGDGDNDVINFVEVNVVTAQGLELTTSESHLIIDVDAEVRGAETMNVSGFDGVTVVTDTSMADQDSVTTGVQNDINANVIGTVTLNLTNLNQIEPTVFDQITGTASNPNHVINDNGTTNARITADIMRFDSSLTTINLASEERWLETGPATEVYEAGTSTRFSLDNLRDQNITLSAFEATGVTAGALVDDTILSINTTTGAVTTSVNAVDVNLDLNWESVRGLTDKKSLTIDAVEAFDINVSINPSSTDLADVTGANAGDAASLTDDDDMLIEQFTLTFKDAFSHSVNMNGFGDESLNGRTELDADWLVADGNNSLDTVLTVNSNAAAGESIDVEDVSANTITFGNAAGVDDASTGEIAADVTLRVTADNVYNIATGTGDDIIDMRADNVRADDAVDTNGDYDRADYVNASTGRDTLIVDGSDALGVNDVAAGTEATDVDDDVFEKLTGIESIIVDATGVGAADITLDEAASDVTGVDEIKIVGNGDQTSTIVIGNNYSVGTTADNQNNAFGDTTTVGLVIDATDNDGETDLIIESKDDDDDIDMVNMDVRGWAEGGLDIEFVNTGDTDARVEVTILTSDEQDALTIGEAPAQGGDASGSVELDVTAGSIDKIIIADGSTANAGGAEANLANNTLIIEDDWTGTAIEIDASGVADTDAALLTGGLTVTVESGDTANITLHGTQNNDNIVLGAGADTINGNAGDDTIEGDMVANINDVLTLENDTFRAGDSFTTTVGGYVIVTTVGSATASYDLDGAGAGAAVNVAIAGNIGTSPDDVLSAMQTTIIAARLAGGDTDWTTVVDSETRTLTVVQTVAEQAAGDVDITGSVFTAAAAQEHHIDVSFDDVDAATTGVTAIITAASGAVFSFTVAGAADFQTALDDLAVLIEANANFDEAENLSGNVPGDVTLHIVGAAALGGAFTVAVTTNDVAYSTTQDLFAEYVAATDHADNTIVTDLDVINGAADTINGGSGDDTIEGMVGADVIDGGTGTNTATYVQSNAAVSVNLATGTNTGGHAAGDTLTNIVNVTGSAFGDTLVGDASANALTGGAGNDTLTGNGGADTFVITAGGGVDTITDYTSSDTIDVDALLDGITKAYEEIADDGADITTDANVVVIGGVTTIGAAAAAIAADGTVGETDGLIVFSDGTDTFIYSTGDLAGNTGAETLLVTLTGVSDATSLVAGSFTFA